MPDSVVTSALQTRRAAESIFQIEDIAMITEQLLEPLSLRTDTRHLTAHG